MEMDEERHRCLERGSLSRSILKYFFVILFGYGIPLCILGHRDEDIAGRGIEAITTLYLLWIICKRVLFSVLIPAHITLRKEFNVTVFGYHSRCPLDKEV